MIVISLMFEINKNQILNYCFFLHYQVIINTCINLQLIYSKLYCVFSVFAFIEKIANFGWNFHKQK